MTANEKSANIGWEIIEGHLIPKSIEYGFSNKDKAFSLNSTWRSLLEKEPLQTSLLVLVMDINGVEKLAFQSAHLGKSFGKTPNSSYVSSFNYKTMSLEMRLSQNDFTELENEWNSSKEKVFQASQHPKEGNHYFQSSNWSNTTNMKGNWHLIYFFGSVPEVPLTTWEYFENDERSIISQMSTHRIVIY